MKFNPLIIEIPDKGILDNASNLNKIRIEFERRYRMMREAQQIQFDLISRALNGHACPSATNLLGRGKNMEWQELYRESWEEIGFYVRILEDEGSITLERSTIPNRRDK